MAGHLLAKEVTNGTIHRFRIRPGSGGENHMEGALLQKS